MFQYKCLNPDFAESGLGHVCRRLQTYRRIEVTQMPLLVRSARMHEMELPDNHVKSYRSCRRRCQQYSS